ncbi:VWA domain-containing protein, partial [Pseudomonas sp. K5002]|uniref:VWA domain-containing protein n=1 Tax=Pseudomonas sp. K5002 TaxID=2738828 RepID=UPI0015BBE075
LRQRPAQSLVLILVTDGDNNAAEIDPLTAARLAAEEGVKIYPIGIGADPEQTGSLGILGVNPSLDLDEPALKAIAEATGGRYFRARDGNELLKIKETLDQLEPVAQQPTQARPAQALYSAPLALALILSMLLVIQERWPDNALQRLFSKLSSKGRFLQPNPEWRERLKRLRLRRRR